ncbi:hypothetical protein GLW20_17090 [Virgibacillus halodenitrificans]|nr:hypothetical protein [Virgibacillus halodenitrificans]
MSVIIFIIFIVALVSISILLQRYVNSYGYRVRAMLSGYVIFLLLCVLVFFLLPTANREQEKPAKEKEEAPYLYELLETGQVDQINKQYIREKWEYPYEATDINIQAPDNDAEGVTVMINTANDLENEVRVTFYQTPAYVDNIDISKKIYPPNVKLSEETLHIYKPEVTEVEYAAFTPEFPFRQLAGKSILDDLFEHGRQVLYIQIPDNVRISTNSFY